MKDKIDYHLKDSRGRLMSVGSNRDTHTRWARDLPMHKSINFEKLNINGEIKGNKEIPLTSFEWQLPRTTLGSVNMPDYIVNRNDVSIFN